MYLKYQKSDQASQVSENTFLFNQHNIFEYKEALLKGIDLIQDKISNTGKPFSGVLPKELASEFQKINLDQSYDHLSGALEELERLYLDHAVYFHHPKYLAHLNCPIVYPAILAELILSSVNSSLDTWDQSAGGTLIEQKVIDWTLGKIGLGENADGVFTSGGTQSNLMALLLARDNYCHNFLSHDVKIQGLPKEHDKLRIFTSEASHFSVQKSAAILGLGYDSVVSVPTDSRFKMNAYELEARIKESLLDGFRPMAIVATAGTTDFGSIDPLPHIAALCRKYNIWMHVDAAYGCGLLLSPKHNHLISGIHHADSVTVDYHKSFFQPVSCGAFFAKNKKHLSCVTHHADYLNPLSASQEGTPNLVNKSIQTTRRFDALKVWLTLRTMGSEALGNAFDQVIALAKKAFLLCLSQENIEVVHQPEISTLVFRYRPSRAYSDSQIDEVNMFIRKKLFRSGEGVIAGTKVHGKQFLKFTLLNPDTTIHDIQAVLTLIKEHGKEYDSNIQSKFI